MDVSKSYEWTKKSVCQLCVWQSYIPQAQKRKWDDLILSQAELMDITMLQLLTLYVL